MYVNGSLMYLLKDSFKNLGQTYFQKEIILFWALILFTGQNKIIIE
jgi:hypothetical protein